MKFSQSKHKLKKSAQFYFSYTLEWHMGKSKIKRLEGCSQQAGVIIRHNFLGVQQIPRILQPQR